MSTERTTTTDSKTRFLDEVETLFNAGDYARGMDALYRGLADLRRSLPREEWERFANEIAHAHPVRDKILEDPVTRHSLEKPRGYAGDAVLIDRLYGLFPSHAPTARGAAIQSWNLGRTPARGVRHRRELLAEVIDRESRRHEGRARILSVACGHLREVALAGAVQSGYVAEVVALDADEASLAVAVKAAPGLVTPQHLSVQRLLGRADQLGRFHLIYSAGLYDYLDERFARKLTKTLFGMLEPGGCLVIGNMLPGVDAAGYMESFMGWPLRERSLHELEGLVADVPASEIGPVSTYADPFQAFGYCEIRKGAAARRAG